MHGRDHYPDPVTEEPTREVLLSWANEGRCRATDGCWVDDDADACEHGYPSWSVWAIVLALSPASDGSEESSARRIGGRRCSRTGTSP